MFLVIMFDKIIGRWQSVSKDNRELLLQSCLAFSIRIVGALAGFIFTVVLARVLGIENSGYYFLGLTVISILAAVARFGLDQTVLRYTGTAFSDHNWLQIRDVLKKASVLASVGSLFLSVLLWVLAEWLAESIFQKPAMKSVLQNMAPGIFGLALFTLVSMSLQGTRRVLSSVFTVNIAANIVMIVTLLWLGTSTANVAAQIYSVACFLAFAVGLALWWNGSGNDGGSESGFVAWRDIFVSCIPLWVAMLMGQLAQWSGHFIAGAWVDATNLAQLAVAQRTAMLASFVLIAVNLVVAPRFAAMYKKGDVGNIEALAINSVRLMFVSALPIIGVMLLFPEFLMGLFGDEFIGGAYLLQIMALGQLVNVATGSVGFLLTMTGHEKDMRNIMLFSGPFAVFLGLWLIPVFGATGSAVTTAVVLASQNFIAVWYVKKRLGFNTLAVWKRA
ncbi:MAG: oligosaccharide flippase family protein [Motiliproteus sp.]